MNGHAVSAVPALTGLQKSKSFGINGTSGATSSATASMGSEAASPSPSNASAAVSHDRSQYSAVGADFVRLII
jgi:hypothetical protein